MLWTSLLHEIPIALIEPKEQDDPEIYCNYHKFLQMKLALRIIDLNLNSLDNKLSQIRYNQKLINQQLKNEFGNQPGAVYIAHHAKLNKYI